MAEDNWLVELRERQAERARIAEEKRILRSDADILEAGTYPPKEAALLRELFDIAMEDKTEMSFKNYLEAKAQFILAGKYSK